MYTRFSKYETRLDNDNHGGSIAVPSDNGGLMDALNAAVDVLWTLADGCLYVRNEKTLAAYSLVDVT
jgi:hypothetical protein